MNLNSRKTCRYYCKDRRVFTNDERFRLARVQLMDQLMER